MVVRRLRGECVLVPIARAMGDLSAIYSLNETAGFILDKATAGCEEAEIARRLAEEFIVSDEQARQDTSRLLQELMQIRALEVADPVG